MLQLNSGMDQGNENSAYSSCTQFSNFFFMILMFILCILFPAKLFAYSRGGLDTLRVHDYYKNGDFDKVIQSLEGFQKTRRTCSLSDSMFLEKHLAVVYAANPATRERGRYHMYKLLDMAPNADLIEMFVGEEVDGIFTKVRKEHEVKNPTIASEVKPNEATQSKTIASSEPKVDTIPIVNALSATTQEVNTESAWKSPGAWMSGGAAVALIAVTIFYSNSKKDPPPKTYVVPATASR